MTGDGRTPGQGRGGQGGHEPRARIQARELLVLERSIQGHSQREIAAEEGLTQGAVSKILSRLEQGALEELVDRVERQKARQTLRLDYLYRESLRAWDASKTDATRRVQRKTDRGPGTPGATVAQLVVETQHGGSPVSRGRTEGLGGPTARLGPRCAPEARRQGHRGAVRRHERRSAGRGTRAPAAASGLARHGHGRAERGRRGGRG